LSAREQVAPRPLTGGALMGAASRIAVTVAGGLATIIVARSLGPADFAGYAVALSLVVVLTVVTTLGLEHGIAYYVSTGRWGAHDAHLVALEFSAGLGLVGACIGIGLRLLFPSAFAGLSVELVAVAVGGLPFTLAVIYANYLFLATDRYEPYMLVPALQAVLALALSALGAVVFGVSGAVIGLTLSSVTMGIAASLWALRHLPRGRPAGAEQLRRALAFGLKGYAANALQLVNYRLDLFILSVVASTAVVGSYSTAVAATSLLWVLPGALSDVLYPRVAHLSAKGEAPHLEMVETKSLRHIGLITLVTALLLAAALELLLVPVFGAAYEPAVDLGLILVPGCAAVAISTVVASTVVGRGNPIYSLYTGLVSTPVTVLLYVSLIPWLHATGAALASTLSYLCSFGLISHFYRRVTGRRVLPLLVPTRAELDDLRAIPRAAVSRARAFVR
jgi:O-antigen/teichoic acid export membrane protein